jgi:hypothetical protein
VKVERYSLGGGVLDPRNEDLAVCSHASWNTAKEFPHSSQTAAYSLARKKNIVLLRARFRMPELFPLTAPRRRPGPEQSTLSKATMLIWSWARPPPSRWRIRVHGSYPPSSLLVPVCHLHLLETEEEMHQRLDENSRTLCHRCYSI